MDFHILADSYGGLRPKIPIPLVKRIFPVERLQEAAWETSKENNQTLQAEPEETAFPGTHDVPPPMNCKPIAHCLGKGTV